MATSMDDYLAAVEEFNKTAKGIAAIVDGLTNSFDAALRHSDQIRSLLDQSDASIKDAMMQLRQKWNALLAKEWDQ